MVRQSPCHKNTMEIPIAVANSKSRPFGAHIFRPAPAKINLFLHVKNRRADGYHEIESLVVFTDLCDHIKVEDSDGLELLASGPFASALPSSENNLIFRAARLLARAANIKPRARIFLKKVLPVAAGIGGGSADAAATLLALIDLWKISISAAALHDLASNLGADVPVCLSQSPRFISGVGHDLEKIEKLPPFALLLVNPRYPLNTAQVFRHLSTPFPIHQRWDNGATENFLSKLGECQNDLEPPATSLAPIISEVLEELQDLSGCQLARMSGSGSTCYGLFEDLNKAESAAQLLLKRKKNWWVQSSLVRDIN